MVVLADVLGVSPLEALTHLDAAARAGLLVDGAHPGAFRFVHAIVRTTLEESLSPTHRALLHAAIARRWKRTATTSTASRPRCTTGSPRTVSATRSTPATSPPRSATRATERLAHERAVSILHRALDVLGGAPATTQRNGVEARLRVALGRAEFVATRHGEAVEQLYRAAALAEASGATATLAEAALVASLNRRHGRDDPELFRLLERAAETCPPEPAVLPAMLHVRSSRLLPITVRHEERSAMARKALVDLDRMEPVDRATVETEVARACWCPDDADERIALTTRLVAFADEELRIGGPSRWTGVLIEALNLRWAARVQVGEVLAALDDADRAAFVADDAGTSFLLTRVMMGQSMIHATLGNHELAEQLSHDALALSDRHNLVLVQMAIAYSIGRDRGQQQQLSALEQQLGDLVDSNPMFVAAFALVHAEAGQLDDARRLLGALVDHAPWPRNWLWLATTTAALETAVLVGDEPLTERLAAVLNRYSGSWAMAAAELACWGPVDRVLGLAHVAAGRIDQGRTALTRARVGNIPRRVGVDGALRSRARGNSCRRGQPKLTRSTPKPVDRAVPGTTTVPETRAMTLPTIGAPWIEAIDVSEHQCIDFDTAAKQDVGVVIVRAGVEPDRTPAGSNTYVPHVGVGCTSGRTGTSTRRAPTRTIRRGSGCRRSGAHGPPSRVVIWRTSRPPTDTARGRCTDTSLRSSSGWMLARRARGRVHLGGVLVLKRTPALDLRERSFRPQPRAAPSAGRDGDIVSPAPSRRLLANRQHPGRGDLDGREAFDG